MLKKVSAVTLVSLLAFSPVVALAAPEEIVKEAQMQNQEKVTTKQNDIKNQTVNGEKVQQKQDNTEVKKEESKAGVKDVQQQEKTDLQKQQPASEKKVEPVKEAEKEQKNESSVKSEPEKPKAANTSGQPANTPPAKEANEDAKGLNQISTAEFNGNVTGKAKWDAKNNHYVLDVTASVTNSSKQKVSNVYLGVSIPEGLDGEFKDFPVLELEDGSTAIALPLPELEPGKTVTKNVKIPVLGNVAGKQVSKDIELYLINKDGYEPLGKIKGSANIDFSEMNKELRFEGKAKATTCVPNLKENQFTLDFLLTTQNLTMDELKGFDVQIDVPQDIKLTIPDHYTQGEIPDYLKDGSLQGGNDKGTMNLDIKWNGNSATVPVKAMEGGAGSALYFQVVGETTKDLKDLKVTFTAKRGDKTITIQVPIEKVEQKDCKKQDTGGNNKDDGKGDGGNKPDTQVPNPNQVNNQQTKVTPTPTSTPTKIITTPKVDNTKSLPKTGASSSDHLLTLLGVVMLAGGAFVYKRSRTTVNK